MRSNLPPPQRAISPVARHCWACLAMKPVSDFRPSQRYLCRACANQRNREWRRANPDKYHAIQTRKRKTPRGMENHKACRTRWKKANKWAARERMQRHIRGLTDFYIKMILKKRGNKNPSQSDIENKRRSVQALRARRALKFIAYGLGTQNQQLHR